MSQPINTNGSPHEGGPQEGQNKKADQRNMTLGRPSPINTTIAKDAKKQPLTATTASSTGYSPSVMTGSSVQFTPATSAYSPSIWSDGAGTPMSVASATETPELVKKTSNGTTFPSIRVAKRTPPETPSKGANQGTHASESPAAPLPPHHFIGGEPGKQYGVVYLDKNGAFFPFKCPLAVDASGVLRDANGQACPAPSGANTFAIDGLVEVTSGGGTGTPKANTTAKNDGADEAYTVVASTYEIDKKPVEPFIEVEAASAASEITPHFTKTHPHLAGQKPIILAEESAGGNWKVQLNDNLASFQEGYAGAITTLKSLNPSHMSMRLGDRVICIKTEFVRNIWWAVQRGVWVAMDKVGERINQLKKACQAGETVFLLFSVNGQKSYCGLAKLNGPWVPKNNEELEGWTEREEGTKTMGVLPVVWTHIKNVPYEYFKDIMHSHSGQPIVNMWNGMHFPMEKGREVVARYAKAAHFTNVIAWRADRPYNPFKEITHSAQLDPRLKTTPNDMTLTKHKLNARQAPRNASYGANTGQVQQQSPASAPPTIRDRRGVTGGNVNTGPPNLDGSVSPSPLPGQRVSLDCIIDTNGNYVPVTPSRKHADMSVVPNSNNSLVPSQQGNAAYNQQPGGQQQTMSYNTRGRGGLQGCRNFAGRGGKTGQLRGAASFIHPGMMHINQNGYGHAMPLALHGAQSFNNGFQGYVQPLPLAPMSPAIHRIQSEVGFNGNAGMMVSPYAAPPTMGFAPQMQHNTEVLRQAASKANFFVPSGPPSATGTMSFNVGFNNGSTAGVSNDPFTMPPIQHTASHSPGVDSAKTTASKTSLTHPSPKDTESVEEMRAEMKEKEKEMLAMNKQMINAQGEWSHLHYKVVEALKAKGLMNDSDAADLLDPYNSPDAWDQKYEMGSSTTLERRCVSPVCNSEGDILDSVSKHDSPQTKARRRETNHRERFIYGQCDEVSTTSAEKRVIANLDNMVKTPPESVAGEKKEGSEVGGGVSLE